MMRLILTENIDGLGGKGDVVDVADGYGRNYLVPRKLAIKATAGALKEAERLRAVREEELQRVKDIAEAITKFTGVSVAHEHIDLRSPIKEIGLHEVQIKPHPEVVFPLTLDVIPA